jgi:3'-5' exoribonuclease
MLKIKDMALGNTVDATLLVKTSQIKKTGAGKPYLFAELTDGTDTVTSQDWDYGDNPPPAPNTILDIRAQVSEYAGKKQLKLMRHSVNTTVGVELFAPSGDFDIVEYVAKAKELIDSIQNIQARQIVQRAFSDNTTLWKSIPSAKGVHHAFVAGNLKHTVDVATKAKVIAEITPMCNVDLVVAGALVHDLGKLWTYVLNGAVIDMTDQGQMIEHIVIGIKQTEKYRTEENSDILDLIQHIQSSHHGELEYGSPTTPRFLEAVIVNYADGIDAKTQLLLEANASIQPDAKFTDKVWAMKNRPMFAQNYIAAVMKTEE